MGVPVKWDGESSRGGRREKRRTVRVVVRQRQRRTAAWRARAGPWQQRGAVAEASGGVCARGIDGRPRSAAQAAHGRPVWAPQRRGGASPCSCRGVSVNGRARRGQRARSSGGASAARRGSAAAARQRGRGSGAARQRAHARSSACARAQSREERVSGEEREGREKESGEREKKSAV